MSQQNVVSQSASVNLSAGLAFIIPSSNRNAEEMFSIATLGSIVVPRLSSDILNFSNVREVF